MGSFMRCYPWFGVLAFALAFAPTLASTGCKKGQKPSQGAPLPVVFGDCIAEGTFESGPRPAAFDETRFASVEPDEEPEPEPEEEPEPTPEPAFDEGKMGKMDSARDVGQYQMKKTSEAPQLAKKQALDEARDLGVLGAALEDGSFATITGSADFSSGLEDREVYGGVLGDEVGEMAGGFGTGSGTGQTYGGMRGRKSMTPQVRLGNATVEGDLDKNIIRRYIRRNLAKIKYCYEKQLLVNPDLQGLVVVDFTIAPSGSTVGVKAEGVSDEVSSCINGAFKSLQFPKPKGGGIVKVSYPFTFSPNADAAPTPPKPARVADAPPYVPGATNPLRDHGAALETCFRAQRETHGVAVLEMTFGADGAVTTAKAHGTFGDKVSTCLVAAAEKARWTEASGSTRRCSIAVGNAPLDQPLGGGKGPVPLVDIDVEQITYRGAPVASVDALTKQNGLEWKIESLYDLARAEQLRIESSREVLTMSGPTIIRPIGATPMKVVYRVIMSLAAAHASFGLAALRGTEWKPLPPVQVPVVPVPRGTGTPFRIAPYLGRDAEKGMDREPPIRLSILVTKADYLAGISGTNDTKKVPREPGGLDALRAALTKFAEHAGRAGHSDVEIAAEDDVTYADFIAVVDVATAAGLDARNIVDPNSLSVRFTE